MKWVKEKLVPSFEKLNPGKKIILVVDNSPYHHKSVIGSFAKLTKKNMVELMENHSVEWTYLPFTYEVRLAQVDDEDDAIDMDYS